MAAHGEGHGEPRKAAPKFSNEENSWLSSLGKCRIAERYNGQFGIAYRLDGLEKSNSNVRKRCVVLHAYSSVLPFQIYPFRSARSKGCVMISPHAMKKIDALLLNEKGVLLETYCSKK
ncbi:MAG: murein L,D-transpeptidase catalytic domain family protein [Bacteroidales bacterium]|nr:murein L,D-transpeptidase catalytic domain family protein [Bacteroidales bacterium]